MPHTSVSTFATLACVLLAPLVFAQPEQDLPTFARDVAPLLQSHCQDCHRPGQIAPMSLLTYAEVRPWAKAIEKSVKERVMPPFHATGPIGRYIDDLRLTDAQIDVIARWVQSGAPLGNPHDLPKPRTWDETEWARGEPDLVVKMPEYTVRSDGVDDNVNLYSEHVFPEDLWLRAVELRASNPRALHHANVYLTFEGESIPEDFTSREMTEDIIDRPFLMQWLPGRLANDAPLGQAIAIPAGRRIFMNAHYAPSTGVQTDRTRLALYFANGEISLVEHLLGFLALGKPGPIPPNEANYSLSYRRKFKADATVTAFHFHMHYRGKSGSIHFKSPDGTVIAGIEVPNYNFNWQREYVLAEPIAVPAGSEAWATFVWDNSSANPLNPDPSQTVRFGPLTTDEMASASIRFRDADSVLDPPIAIRNGRKVDLP